MFLACGFQIGFWIWFYFGFRKIGNESPLNKENLPPVSVIVVYKNNKNTIYNTIQSLINQQYPTFEVIAMHDFSNDGSELIAQKILHPKLRHLNASLDVQGKKFALSEAISLTKYDELLLTDGDCIPSSENWILYMSMALQSDVNKEIVLGYSPMRYSQGNVNTFSRYETVVTAMQYFTYAVQGWPYMGVGRNLMYTKQLFEANNGFQFGAYLPGGDDDLFIQNAANDRNVAICIDPKAHVETFAPSRWLQFFKQKQRHISTSSLYQWKHKLLLGLFGVTQIWWVLSAILLLLYKPFIWPYVLIMVCLKWSLQYIISKSIFPKLQATTLSSRLPLLDLGMSVYLCIMAIVLPFYKRKW